MRAKKNKGKNLKLALAFLLTVLLLILASFISKIYFIFRESAFDATHSYNVAYLQDNGKTVVISFSPSSHSIGILRMDRSVDSKKIGKTLQIPVDGVIEGVDSNLSKEKIGSEMQNIFLGFDKVDTNLTIIDLARLMVFAKTVPLTSVSEKSIVLPSDQIENSVVLSFFTDPDIVAEKSRIEVVNGTGVSGLGNRLANLLSNIGADVVLVSNSDNIQKKSKIRYCNKKNYTVKRLVEILNFKLEDRCKEATVADVIITIGTDSLQNLKF